MPNVLPDKMLENADAATAFAVQVRKFHRRRTSKSARQRQDDIEVALQRLKEAMAPIRSEIGRFPTGPQTDIAEANRERIRAASLALQSERRKLFKMQQRKA